MGSISTTQYLTTMSKLIFFLFIAGIFLVVATGCAHRQPLGHAKVLFDSTDLNRDGQLTKAEIAEFSHRRLLATYDLNGDNRISADEWDASHPSSVDSDAHFNRIDKDADGHIAVNEAVLYMEEHVDYTNHFGKIDRNDDGLLHFNEYAEAEPHMWNLTVMSLSI